MLLRQLTITALVALLCACASSSDGDGAPIDVVESVDAVEVPDVARASCEAPIGGHVTLSTETAFEAFPHYDEDLAALDLESLPETLDIESLVINVRSLVAYMLHIPLAELPATLTRDEIAAAGPMGQAVLGAFVVAANAKMPGLDLPFLRRGLHRFYQCDRAFPLHIEDFRAVHFEYADEPYYELWSVPKDDIRRIRENAELGIYIAETYIDGILRETEILMSHSRTDGALDFLVYDEAGALMDRSEFVTASGDTVGGASPYGCIACHFAGGSFEINVLFPQMDPVAPPKDIP